LVLDALFMCKSMSNFVSPDIFFAIVDRELVLWNYRNHRQYSLELKHLTRLLEIAKSDEAPTLGDEIDRDLLESGVVDPAGFKTSAWGWDLLSRIFHVGTRDVPQEHVATDAQDWAESYVAFCEELVGAESLASRRDAGKRSPLRLPAPSLSDRAAQATLWSTFVERKTSRNFERRSIDLNLLATLLYFSLGNLAERQGDMHEFVPEFLRMRRSSPSGGGLSATTAYVIVRDVEGIEPAAYCYDPIAHSLSKIEGSEDMPSIGSLCMGQYFADDLPFGVFLVGEFDRMWWKYKHSRGYRCSLLEVGHIGQTVQLAATGLGLKTWVTAAFEEERLDQLLHLDSPSQQVLLFVGAGHSQGDSLDRERRALLQASQGAP
jgi:SagB-type dehydrogenase family enzyme